MAADRKPQQDAAVLEDPESLYHLIADTIPLMVWTARADGAVDFVNQCVEQYTGLDRGELLGAGWGKVVHPDDRERVGAAWQAALRSGGRSENRMRLRRADGQYRLHHGSGVPLRDAQGRVTRWFGICTDIEDQVRGAELLESMVEERTRELRATQARLRALIENEPECVKLIDAQGMLLEMNAAGLRMIEADAAAQVVGRCVYPIVAPQHREAFRELTERVCRGERGTLEFEVVGLKGTRRWLETHAVPFRDEASGATRLLAVTRDITDRKALRESEQRFALFIENLPATAWIRDADFRYTYVNQRYAQAWGVPPAALLGRDAGELFPAATAAYFRDKDRKVLRDGVPIQYIDSLPAGRWFKVKFPVPDGHGGIGVGGIAVDITDRSRLEEALHESEQRFRSFMDHAPAVAWIKDARLRYIYVNRSHEQLFGRPAREVLGREDFELHAPALARFFRDDDEEILRAGVPTQKLHRVPYPDGKPGHWLVVKFPLGDGAGGTGVAGFAIDATPRFVAEEQARRHAAEARQLMDRLVGAQEAERRRVADELHDLIGQNLSALGIDLQALKQQLQAGGDALAGPRLDAMAALVETTIGAIRGVMGELRPAALEEFGLLPALRWHASAFGKRTGMSVSISVEGRALRLSRDTELALFRVLQEALTNAAKHSGGSAVEITLDMQRSGVRLTIADDGRGFDDPGLANGARGGGFGLRSMRERIEAYGGTLRIECPGRGARLVIEIPAPSHAD